MLANSDAAQKYKDYNKIRGILAGKIPPKEPSRAKKRKPAPVPSETPVKRIRHAETPSKQHGHGDELMNSPAISRKLFSPAPVTSLGPTPQRDGRVLGLFDLLVEKELGTPSKKNNDAGKGESRATVQATPTKRRRSIDDESASRLGRTPMSTSKRQMLNDFMTPLKKRDGNAGGGKTPTSVSKLQFDTPAFLKRHSLPTVDEGGQFEAPVSSLRLPRKPLVRGLSEIVASLRRVEEDTLDDDLDALRDIEDEEMGVAPRARPQPRPQPRGMIMEEDSQDHQLPLGGFDDEGKYDKVEETRNRDGNNLRVYKKKGQKRTTRRVNMRPMRLKRPTDMGDGDGDDDDGELVPETQTGGAEADYADAGSGSDFEDETAPKAPKKGKKEKGKKAKSAKDGKIAGTEKEGTVKKAARKVNELAHANFRSLKLRNYGAKGGPGFNSKFRRRR